MLPTPPEGLRHWQADDAPALQEAWADPEIARWSPPPAGKDAAAWIAGTGFRWERRLSLDLVIEPPEDGGVAGEVGLSSFTSDPARAEVGIWVAAEHRGRGLATAAVGAVTRWALVAPAVGGLGLDQLWARTDPANVGASSLFERVGWQRVGESGGKAIWSATAALLR